jgi:hypothetical protein
LSYVIAVLGLAVACMLWYLVQRWARPEGDEPFQVRDPHCESCEMQGSDCKPLSAPGPASDPSRTTRASR